MITEHIQEGILITDSLCWDTMELLIGVRNHCRCGTVLQELRGIIPDDGITDNHLVSVPDDAVKLVVN